MKRFLLAVSTVREMTVRFHRRFLSFQLAADRVIARRKLTPLVSRTVLTWLSLAVFGLAAPSRATAEDDILIADFEGDSYGDWKVEGEAFGARPAVANVRPGNKVTGHQGNGLVNSFLGGDALLGKLTSPEFTVERNHLNFLIGAGNHDGKTFCV